MAVDTSPPRSLSAAWVATWAVPIAAQCAAAVWLGASFGFGSPEVQFFALIMAAVACVLASTALVARGLRTNEAEMACSGTFLWAASTMLLVHGITTPGVIFGTNNAHSLSLFLALPLGIATVAPFLVRGEEATRLLRKHWRLAIGLSFVAVTLAMMGLFAGAQTVPAAVTQHPLAMVIAVAAMLGSVALSQRHFRLANLAQRVGPLIGSLSIGLVAVSSAMWLAPTSFDAAAPAASALLIAGVVVGTLGASRVHRRSEIFDLVIAPVMATEPLSALELSLDPVVRQFVVNLEGEEREVVDHVIRTRDLALGVGNELRLSSLQLRDLGLAALLHDVGKAGIPDEILTKTERLTPDEFETMQRHVEIGEQMVAASSTIASVAPAVRSHHERLDGGGYPDGLAGMDIEQNARIVAVCDAYDAMANSRRYRAGMGHDKAVAILREHAGSQWDPVVVEALVMTLARTPMVEELHVQIDAIGRGRDLDRDRDRDRALPPQRGMHIGCDCVPDSVRASIELLSEDDDDLASVDLDASTTA